MTSSTNLTAAALELASCEFEIFPLAPRRKVPAIPGGRGHLDATSELDQVRQWWHRRPRANIGIRPPIGSLVLDIDPRNGGDSTIRRLVHEHGELPETLTVRTGSGGWHLWFEHPGRRLSAAHLEGVDLKSHTGYVVAPPSIHPCGGTYEWVSEHPPGPLPEWLRRSLVIPANPHWGSISLGGDRSCEGLERVIAEAPVGERNNRLFWAACRAVEQGLDPFELIPAAEAAGLDTREIAVTIRSAQRTAGGSQ